MGRPAGSKNKSTETVNAPVGDQISFLPERVHLVVPYGKALSLQLKMFNEGDTRTLEQYCQGLLNDSMGVE